MPSPILARADALMQRRRPHTDADDVPVLTDAVDLSRPETDDDIPVLCDIEVSAPRWSADGVSAAPLPQVATPEEVPFPTLNTEPFVSYPPTDAAPATAAAPAASREDIVRDIAGRVEKRLAAELPRLIAAAVADYLAEQDPPSDGATPR